MSERNVLQQETNKLDAIFGYIGLCASVLYIAIIVALVATLLYGSFPSISRFSFSFLTGTQWNIRQGIVFPPRVSLEQNIILVRFSVPIKTQDIDTVVRLMNIDKGKTLTIVPTIKDRVLTISAPLGNGTYELFISKDIQNATGAPLLDSWRYTFTALGGAITNMDFIGETTGKKKHIAEENTNLFGALPFLFGTVVSSILALCLSLPFAIAIAIYLNEYVKNTRRGYILSSISDLLAGIPSVIYGFWGMFFIAPYLGSNILTASIVLAVMTLPYSTAMTREAIALVPNKLRYAGYAMGATHYSVLLRIVIPYAKSGIIAGVMLALGRALGETLAVTMVIGNSNRIPTSLFEPAQTISSLIANEYAEASGMKQSALMELGLLLILITMIFALLGRLFIKKSGDTL